MKTIALAGNPNCGKTSIFNILTKTRQHVGNWPGVTVEKKEGTLKYNKKEYKVVDLPGTYSLGAYSEDEIIARNYIINEKPDVVINVVDATNLERNLYMTLQLLEMNTKVILAVNMMDEAQNKGISIDIKKLSKELGITVIPTVALKSEGINELIEAAISDNIKSTSQEINYGDDLEKHISILEEVLKNNKNTLGYEERWLAIKLLENDSYIKKLISEENINGFTKIVDETAATIEDKIGFEAEIAIVDKRYEKITEIVSRTIVKKSENTTTLTDKIDKVITNKFLGLPIFAIVMLILYQITFTVGAGIQDWTDVLIADLGEKTVAFLETSGAPDLLLSFVGDALFAGVAAVVAFLPLIMVMYFLIGVLEDSGYMARAAYVMDRVMRSIGLHGKTFVSMLVSIGCNVPGIMATRTLDNKKDRMIAILINPFISCGARLPIYAVFISAFFDSYQALILFELYVTGLIIALIAGKIFSKTIFKGDPSHFVMELPSYRVPSLKNILMLMWDKAGAFIKRAGVVILPVMIILWVLSTFPLGSEQYSENTLLGMIGTSIAPLFKYAGFGTWQASVSLITGILAKETVVGTMGLIYSGISEGPVLVSAVQTVFTPLSAMAFMVMSLLYTPCLVALGAIKRETNSWKWTLFTAVYTFLVGLVAATVVYQIGSLLGFQ
ncbi:ferrous iron transport protein B [Clostridium chauvoei]|uniref:Ferrous iron transport protein B n=2 Tax=Clostridium chauvoei TaxID=46867 RepID=S6FLJ7_9CLOT|nr:ferrous iron transport protein B [Clostridium chauvoei]ATD54825.1 ferrous iron transport protein B [Clostridium chauvoei]ATD57495.1 ferrous iron transport protein B [Clostridium chauvoei]MBX7281172.1 ferrous iron transport protein B [Clostridium chauvoei]MBX7283652.1 ferrous iron transport protein B [Clostridium chauvoei]MBX7286260.1 ferrous iron transport protein B [Clostridium chauvoei]